MAVEKYQYLNEMEDMVLSLNKENLKVIVVCAGIWYGKGENLFRNLFKVYIIYNLIHRVLGFKILSNCLTMGMATIRFPQFILRI